MTEKIIYIDVETTGLKSEVNGIWQVGVIIEIDGIVKEELDLRMNPGDVVFDQSALDACNITKEEILTYPDQKIMFEGFSKILSLHVDKFDKTDKFKLVCHNVSFDFDFLKSWFERNGDNYMGSYINFKEQFCTFRVFQALRFAGIIHVESNIGNTLSEICKHIGKDLDNAHDALSDINACRDVFKWELKLLEMIE